MVNQELLVKLAESLGRPPAKFDWQMRRFLGPCDLRGARVLDVGCGAGGTTFFAACRGAREVIGLEPEADGSTSGEGDAFHRTAQALGFRQCNLLRTDFMQYATDEPFDVVILHDSINHIREVRTDIRRDPAARQSQSRIVAHIAEMVRPDGWVVLSDCSRRNLWGDLKRRSPFAPSIEWDHHQTPTAWRMLLSESGFGRFSLEWHVPYNHRRLAWAFNNRLANYLTVSWFILRGRKSPA